MEDIKKINIEALDDYSFLGGTIMLVSTSGDPNLGVTRQGVINFVEDLKKDLPDFIYYGVRYAGNGNSRVHLDFLYAYKRSGVEKDTSNHFDVVVERGVIHNAYKNFGRAVHGYDVSSGIKGIFINTELLNLKKSNK